MNTDTLEARLLKLEKQNRLLITALLLGVGLIACTSAALKQDASRTAVAELRAQRIVLVDAKDKELGVWETGSDGLPLLVMGTNSTTRAVIVGETKDGAALRLNPPSGPASSWIVSPGSSVQILQGRDPSSAKIGSLVLNGSPNPLAYLLNANGAKIQVNPGTAFPVTSYRQGGKLKDWSFTGTDLSLNGLTLNLNDYNGKLIKQLP